MQQGYTVFPINPKGGEIEGLQVYLSLSDVPVKPLQRISVYLPPAIGIRVLEEIAEVGCEELYLNPGTTSEELLAKAETLGLEPIQACSIVDLGMRPSDLA
jgi:predicted CoA-binding protein